MQKTVPQKQSKKVFIKKEDEKILVIPTKILFSYNLFTGIKKVAFDSYQKLIEQNKQFLWRSKMEVDSSYKQIIPYLIFSFQDKFFLMQRRGNSNETRLKNLYSLGIGGHIRQDDIKNRSIFDWAKREFAEEINYNGKIKIEAVGLLNDESNDVGKVHAGFVFLLKGDSNKISIKSELKHGSLLPLQECKAFYQKMENWSQIVFDYLVQNQDL